MKYLIANWKMNLSLSDTNAWFDTFEKNYVPKDDLSIVLCPSFPLLPIVKSYITNLKNVFVGAQNFSELERGAHTGQTGLFQIKDFVNYVILGHSELKEERQITQQKVNLCLEKTTIVPIICHKNADEAFEAIGALHVFEDPQNISTINKDQKIDINLIKDQSRLIMNKIAENEVIYGGSVNGQNAQDLIKIPGTIGLLVGNASLNPEIFLQIAQKI